MTGKWRTGKYRTKNEGRGGNAGPGKCRTNDVKFEGYGIQIMSTTSTYYTGNGHQFYTTVGLHVGLGCKSANIKDQAYT